MTGDFDFYSNVTMRFSLFNLCGKINNVSMLTG